ncbi:secreted RxLR effector protein 161-like [Apium graveolens]|uniref:secreted RxLR effector protein 161-like n=1 Tax=Apium graveolens TaxID=4045 RepID=UPI003D7B0E32
MLYLTSSRPDIAFVVQHPSQLLHAPRTKHLEAVHRVLRYLQLTKDHGLFFSSQNNLQLKGYSDSDWGGCAISRRSVGGYTFFLGNVVVSWRSKKQHVVSKSSAKAEYRALADASCEAVWLTGLLKELACILLVLSKDNAADILTKGLGKALHWKCSSTHSGHYLLLCAFTV